MSKTQTVTQKMSQHRWTIVALLFFATTINYLDRQVLSLTWDEFIKPNFTGMNLTTNDYFVLFYFLRNLHAFCRTFC